MVLSVLVDGIHQHRHLIELATRAEALGLNALYYADERFHRDVYVGLAACAAATERLRLGTAVTDPYTRHPAITAAAIASLQELSEGRALLGIGAGAFGLSNLHIAREHPAAAIGEAVSVIRSLLAGTSVSLQGRVVSISDGQLRFTPTARVPIYVAADGPHTLKVAGRVADGVIVPHCASPTILRERLARTGEFNERGERLRVVARLDVALAEDRSSAMDVARVRMVRYLWGRYPDIGYLADHGLALPPALEAALRSAGPFQLSKEPDFYRPMADLIPDELIAPIVPAGTPREVAAGISRVLDAGADEVMAYLLTADGRSTADALELFGGEVLPQVRVAKTSAALARPAATVSRPPPVSEPTHPWVVAQEQTVRFGVALGPRSDWLSLRHFVEAAEELGLDSYWHPDHPLRGTDCWAILSGLAAVTRRIRLGTLVTCPQYRHPVLLARMAADVDRISGGRLVLGLGSGDAVEEFTSLGVPFGSPGQRLALLEEATLIILDLLRDGATRRMGRYFDVNVPRFESGPVQRPYVPLMIAGGGERVTLAQVARHADVSNFGPHERMGGAYSRADIERKYDVLRSMCAKEDRAFSSVLRSYAHHGLMLARTSSKAEQKLAAVPEAQRRDFAGSLVAMTPPEAVRYYEGLVQAGVRYFIVGIRGNDLESLELLANEVAPAVSGTPATGVAGEGAG